MACAIGTGLAGLPAFAQTAAPDAKTLRIVVPFAPGGAQDVIGRYLGTQRGAGTGMTGVGATKPGAELQTGAGVSATRIGRIRGLKG